MIVGPLIRISPASPSGASTLIWTVATGRPTEFGRAAASDGEMIVAAELDSVSPYTFDAPRTLGNVSRTFRCSSSADGEPPNATVVTDDVSKSCRLGCSHTRHTIVGTVAQIATCSRSI